MSREENKEGGPDLKKQKSSSTSLPTPSFTPIPQLQGMLAELQAVPQHTIPLADRKHIIERIKACLIERADSFRDAEFADLRRPAAFHDKVRGGTIATCDYYLANIDRLATQQACDEVAAPAPGSRARRSFVRHEPRGLALVIGTWNFPLPLHIKPIVTAIAAGCPSMLKCNDQCAATSAVMLRVLGEEYLEADPICRKYVKICVGKRDLVHEMLQSHWGMVFFTGGEAAAKHICRAAAEHLSPVCMELGGKNPVYVTRNANLENAVLKLVDNKFQNVGQFCVSPDHVYLDSSIDVAEFERLVKEAVGRYFGDDPQKSKNYSRVINASHHRRLVSYRDAADHGGRNLLEGTGGQVPDEADLYIPPTIVLNPSNDKCLLLTEEVFGPVLPIIQYDDLDEVLRKEAALPNPLALYIFSGDDAEVQKIVTASRSGGVCVNDCITQMLAENLPFGGIGASGFGSYRGDWGFRLFSHERSVMEFDAADFNEARVPSQ
jgi:aldehyde dehydrogenase (NAD+)